MPQKRCDRGHLLRLTERFARLDPPASCSSSRKTGHLPGRFRSTREITFLHKKKSGSGLGRRSEPLPAVLVPAAHEFRGESCLLAGTHRAYELFGELTADDLDHRLVRRTRGFAALTLANDIDEHQLNEPSRTSRLVEMTLGLLQWPRRASCPGHCSEPPAE